MSTTAISPHIREVLERCVRRADDNVKVITRSATTQDIINLMLHCDTLISDDMQELAQYLEGTCPEETMSNIHFVLTQCVEFIEDPNGKQDLMAPNALLKRGYGDCKSFSLFIASVCQSLNIPYIYRFVSETASGNVHHVYVVAPLADGYEVICDATLDRFNTEPPYAKSIDHIMVADDAQEKVVEQFYSKRGEAMPGTTAAKQSVSGAHIGDITDQFIFKLAPNKRDALRATIRDNIRTASPFFLYLFYFKTWEAQTTPIRPLPRAAIYKLKSAIEIFWKMSTAFQMDVAAAAGPFQLLSVAIDKFFKNETRLVITPAEHTENWTILTEGYPSWAITNFLRKEGSNYIFDLNEAAISTYYARMMQFTLNGKKVYQHLEMLPLINSEFIEFQKEKGAPANLETPEGVIKNSFTKAVSDNAWVTGYYTARSSEGNLVVFCLADDFQKMKFTEMFPTGSYVYIDLRFYTGDSGITAIKGVQRVKNNLKQGNLIALEFDVQVSGSSQNLLAGIYRLPPLFDSITSAQGYITKTGRFTNAVTPAKATAINVLPSGSYEVSTTLATTTSTTNAFGTLTLPGGTAFKNIFDPDGLPIDGAGYGNNYYKPFSVESKTPYISSARVGDFGVSAIVAIITAVTTILTTIAGIIMSIKAPGMGDAPDPTGDFRYDPNNCKWHDQSKGILTCPLLDGSGWVLVQQGTGEVIAEDPSGGEGGGGNMEGLSTFALIAAGGLFLVSGIDDKPKRKTTRRKVNGRTYTLARRKWKKRA